MGETMERTMEEFRAIFHSEEMCRLYLFEMRWPDGYECLMCGPGKHYFIESRDVYECRECGYQNTLTAGTLFHRTKLPLQYWFIAIYLVVSNEGYSARALSRSLQVNYRTALRMLRVLRYAMAKDNGRHLLSNFIDGLRSKVNNLTDNNSVHGTQTDSDSAYKQPEVVLRVKQIMLGKVREFIRGLYRRVSQRYFQGYLEECYFWRSRQFNGERAIADLIFSCSSTYPNT